ncbi:MULTISPECIES: LysR family transcriptional regulator [Streptomyces]|nr:MULTISPECIES: LysR family transcriptional regulator [Streptomyces]KAF0650429.1 LysR family transcriptional regulator [Streptomyces fradiae ATCC 10745 = DSM 40063]QEV14701.1 LysR family transcriptional regulator [Streptomyces fradiae ATCC 10745 = DSM 40063]
MDAHLLRTFVTVTRLASFPAAARELGCSRDTVARHVATLERHLGLPLLTRRPVVPTVAGARLLEHAVPLLLRLDAAGAELARLAAAPDGELAVAAAPLAVGARLLAALPAATARVTLSVRPRDEIPAAVASGAAALGLVDGVTRAGDQDPLPPPGTETLTALRVAEAPLAVHLPATHPLAHRAGLRLGELTGARWVDAPAAGLPLDHLRAAHGTYGFRPALRYDGTDLRTLTALAAAGQGLALLPATVPAAPAATAVPLVEPRLTHRVVLLHPGEPSAPAADLTARLTTG